MFDHRRSLRARFGVVVAVTIAALLGSACALRRANEHLPVMPDVPAVPAKPASSEPHDPINFTTPNGMAVALWEDHRAPSFNLIIRVAVGSADEPPGRGGFAHLFEHLMFTGTKAVPSYNNTLYDAGASDWNAYTAREQTVFHLNGRSAALATALWVEADRFTNIPASLAEDDIDSEREIVLNEFRETVLDRPIGAATESSESLLVPKGHPYHRPVIGSMADLRDATVDDARDFFARFYVPSQTTLMVGGDFDPTVIRPIIEELFGRIPVGAPDGGTVNSEREGVAMGRAITPCTRCAVHATATGSVTSPHVLLEWAIPPATERIPEQGDAAPPDRGLEMTQILLGSPTLSPLRRRMIDELNLATSISVNYDPMRGGGFFTVAADVADGIDPGVVKAQLVRELEAVSRDGFTDEEYVAARIDDQSSLLNQTENPIGLAWLLLAVRDATGGFSELADYVRRLDDVDDSQVTVSVGRLLASRSLAMTVVKGARSDYPRVLVDSTGDAPSIKSRRPRNVRLARPEFSEQADPLIPTPTVHALPNGASLVYFERPGSLQTSVTVSVLGGRARDPLDRIGRADLLAAMIEKGDVSRTATEFGRAMTLAGATLSVDTSATTYDLALEVASLDGMDRFVKLHDRRSTQGGLNGTVSSSSTSTTPRADTVASEANLLNALGLLNDVLTHPRLAPTEFDDERSAFRSDIEQAANDPSALADRAVQRQQSVIDPRSRSATLSSIDRVGFDELRNEFAAVFQPQNTTVVAAGPLSAQAFASLVTKTIPNWANRGAPVAPSVAPVQKPTPMQTVLVDLPGTTQSLIEFAGSASGSLSRHPFEVEFGEDLLADDLSVLRKDYAITYGTQTASVIRPDASTVWLWGSFEVKSSDTALDVILDELNHTDASGWDSPWDVSEHARHGEVLALLSRASNLVAAYLERRGQGLDWAATVQALAHIGDAQDPIRTFDVHESLFDGRQRTMVIVGDLKVIRPLLKGRELGVVKEVLANDLVK
jgi:zinc protease